MSKRRGLSGGNPAQCEWGCLSLLVLMLGGCSGRIHRLALTGDKRADIQLNSFGFYTNGSLEVELSLLRLGLQETKGNLPKVGFSLSRVRSGSVRSYSSRNSNECPLDRNSSNFLVLFLINIKDLQVHVRKYGEQEKLFISPGLLPETPSQSGLPKSAPAGTPKENDDESSVHKEDQAKPTAPQVSEGRTTPEGHRHSIEGQPPRQLPTQDPSGKKKELVLGLGHLNDSYNFSVSTCPAHVSPPPPNPATAEEPSKLRPLLPINSSTL